MNVDGGEGRNTHSGNNRCGREQTQNKHGKSSNDTKHGEPKERFAFIY